MHAVPGRSVHFILNFFTNLSVLDMYIITSHFGVFQTQGHAYFHPDTVNLFIICVCILHISLVCVAFLDVWKSKQSTNDLSVCCNAGYVSMTQSVCKFFFSSFTA